MDNEQDGTTPSLQESVIVSPIDRAFVKSVLGHLQVDSDLREKMALGDTPATTEIEIRNFPVDVLSPNGNRTATLMLVLAAGPIWTGNGRFAFTFDLTGSRDGLGPLTVVIRFGNQELGSVPVMDNGTTVELRVRSEALPNQFTRYASPDEVFEVSPQIFQRDTSIVLTSDRGERNEYLRSTREEGRKSQSADPGKAVKMKRPMLFLSYAREDRLVVESLYERLLQAEFKPWMDVRDIVAGEKWKLAIRRAIRAADFFIVCLSNASANKRGVLQREIKEALDLWEEKREDDIYVIPLRLEECSVPEVLQDFQWLDLGAQDGWAGLVRAVQTGMERRTT